MNTNLDLFLQLRRLVLICGKLLAISLCLYYISQYQNYHVQWSILSWIMPSYTQLFDNFLSRIGTLILVLPLTVLVSSLLMPQHLTLQLVSNLFGIFSILISTIRSLMNNSLGEVTNFKFFAVAKVMTIQQKRDIFITEYKRIAAESYMSIIKVYNELLSKLTPSDILVYDNTLQNLHESSQIKDYAAHIIAEYVTILNHVNPLITYKKYIFFAVGFIAVAAVCYIANTYSLDDLRGVLHLHKKGMELVRDGANINLAQNQLATGALEINLEQNNALLELTKQVASLNIRQDLIAQRIDATITPALEDAKLILIAQGETIKLILQQISIK